MATTPIFVGVDVGALLQEIDAGAARLLVVVAQEQPAEADRLAGAGPVHDQDRDAALDQVGHAGDVLDLLGDVEAVEEHDAGRARGFRVLGMHEIARQALPSNGTSTISIFTSVRPANWWKQSTAVR